MRVATRRALLSRRAAAAPVGPGTGFISTWKTDNIGASNDDQITIPVYNGGAYDCTVYWGDGTSDVISTWNDAAWTHTYATAGTYTVEIVGQCEGFRFNNGGDKTKILTVEQFGADFRLLNANGYFFGCSGLTSIAADLDTTGTTNFSYAWRGCEYLQSFPAIDLSGGTNFYSAWQFCYAMTEFLATDIGSGSFDAAWNECTSLESFPALDLSGGTSFIGPWNACTSMTEFLATAVGGGSFFACWYNCNSLLNIPAINLSGSTDFTFTFASCTSLAEFLATGISRTFSLAGCGLDAAALDVVYTNLATVVSKTITVTGNPGVGGDDPSIATAKGWTVTGS